MKRVLLAICFAALASAQEKPPVDSWLTYNGDYSGRRFSPLTLLNTKNVDQLSLAWSTRVTNGQAGHGVRLSATPLLSDGVLYISSLDNVWAMDARTGRELWRYYRESIGPMPRTGNRGVGLYHGWLFFLTIDDHLVSLDAATGKQRWIVKVSDAKQYFHCDRRSGHYQEPRHHRFRRRFSWHLRICRSARSRNRRAAMEVANHSRQRTTGHRNMARRICGCIRRRPSLDPGHL